MDLPPHSSIPNLKQAELQNLLQKVNNETWNCGFCPAQSAAWVHSLLPQTYLLHFCKMIPETCIPRIQSKLRHNVEWCGTTLTWIKPWRIHSSTNSYPDDAASPVPHMSQFGESQTINTKYTYSPQRYGWWKQNYRDEKPRVKVNAHYTFSLVILPGPNHTTSDHRNTSD